MNRNDRNEQVLDKMLGTKIIKSSRESTERAYDVCEYVNKELRNNPRNVYNGWFISEKHFEYDYAWFKVEHTDYSVRLQFTFTNTDFVYVDGYFTNGSYYDKKTITSWNYGRETPEETLDHVKNVLDSFFDSGIEMLNSDDKKLTPKPAKKQIKSSVDNNSILNKLNDAWNLLHNVKIELRKQKNQNEDAEIYYNDIVEIAQELSDFLDEFEKNPV